MLLISDIDGTVADDHDIDWRRPDLQVAEARPYPDIVRLLKTSREAGAILCFVTGRPLQLKAQTIEWLDRHVGGPYGLCMRPDGVAPYDLPAYKVTAIDQVAQQVKPDRILVFEDNVDVLRACRALDAALFRCTDGSADRFEEP